ncbi:hypothetical protein DAT39_003451, partial [Clarias magur]
SRVMKSSDTRKQKEFFEKKRMQNRHNLLVPPPASPKKVGGSMDLLTMFIVNRIALKKEHAGMKKSVAGKTLELPMSPCSPSRLSLAESESLFSDQSLSLKKRKPSLLDEFKLKTMTPLVESNLFDNSTPANQHWVQGSVGSFSSTLPSLSESFNLRSRPAAHIASSPPTESHCTKYAQPVGMCEYNSWTVPFQTEASQASFADGVQFVSSLHSRESSGPSIQSTENPFHDLETNSQEERQPFFALINEGEVDLSGKKTTKPCFQTENPHAPTRSHDFIKSYSKDRSIDFLSQHVSRCADCRPCRVHRIISEHVCESPVTCSREEGCVTSDDAANSVPSLQNILEKGQKQHGDSYMYLSHSKDIMRTSQSCPSGMSAPTRVLPCNQSMMCRESKAYGITKALKRINYEQDCERDQFVPSWLQTNMESGRTCKKVSPRIQDKATQTAGFYGLISQDASVQCCILKAPRMGIFTAPRDHSHHSKRHKAHATRRQTCHSSEKHGSNQVAQSEIHKVERNTSWMMSKTERTKQDPEMFMGHECLSESESQTCMKKHSLLPCFQTNAP